MECITSMSFSILINGVPHRYFYPQMGGRQDDPLSPYIFMLYIEPLIRHLSLITSNLKSHVGILSSPRGFKISNLFFSNDCLLFAKATVKGARTILSILKLFLVSLICLLGLRDNRQTFINLLYISPIIRCPNSEVV